MEAEIKAVKVPKHLKEDPEIPNSLSIASRQRREELLKRGLSNFYIELCFDAYEQNFISTGRLAEILLVSDSELEEIAGLYRKNIKYGS